MPAIRITEESGVRYLQFGAHWIQGAMRINRPWALELQYTRDMMFPLLLRTAVAWPRSVLLIGLGAASLTKFVYRQLPQARLTVVEIDPEVVVAAWQFFGLPQDSRHLRIQIADGYEYVAATRRRYDLILADGFDAKVRAGDLDSPAFYRNCRARLNAGGMFATNLVSRRGRPMTSIERIRGAFDGRVLALPPDEANTIAIASIGRPIRVGRDELREAAHQVKARTGLDLAPTADRLVGPRRGGQIML
jgi:spermidine synthase